jgi:microcystin degradation protein MlrC
MALRGRECSDVLARILKDGLRPTMALHRIPMIWGMNQVTAHLPMKEAIDRLHEIEARPGVVCASIHTGFALADVPEMGASVSVVTDGDREEAQRLADELGAWIYDRKEVWQLRMPSAAKALDLADREGRYPVILADREDNTGGGAPGDSTGVLRAFVERDLKDACVLYIVDPEAVERCHAAGAGTTLDLDVGGKSAPEQGAPVRMSAEVVAVSDGRFRYDGPMYEGLEGSMGPSAHIRQRGVHVLLVTEREQPFCTGFSRTLGLDPKQMRYIAVKSAAHFRSGFEPWAAAIHVVSEPCVHRPEGGLTYRRLGREVYPIDA